MMPRPLRLADHRHDIGGKPIGLGLYAVYTRGLRSMPAATPCADWTDE
jgi:hypothetical protein